MMIGKAHVETKPELQQKLFTLDSLGDNALKGWSDGTLWNGWESPVFEFEEAQKLLNTLIKETEKMGFPIQAWYDDKEDSFCFILDKQSEPECYSAIVIEANGKEMKVYPIGSSAWIWEEFSSQ